MATTAMSNSFKSELAQGAHCFLAPQTGVSATGAASAFTLTGLASTAALAVGMAVTGTNVAPGAVIASIDSTSQVTLSKAHAGAVTSVNFAGDTFKILLIKASPAGTYDATNTNVGTPGTGTPSATNVGTDETSGAGYTSGGVSLANITPAVGSGTAFWSFSANPSWTGATFSAVAALIYNSAARLGGILGRMVSVHDFGGTQTVSSGTFTITLPTNNSTLATLRIA